MASTNFTNNVTLSDAEWFDDVNSAVYNQLSSVAGTNTVTGTGPVSMTAYAANQRFFFIPAGDNTGATTVNITPSGGSALGAKNIFFNGAACVGGELKQNVPALIWYDGTQFNLLNHGQALGGNLARGLIYLSTVSPSNAATADIETTFSSTYDTYLIVGSSIKAATDGAGLTMQMKVGGAYDSGNNYQYHVMAPTAGASTYAGEGNSAQASIKVFTNVGNAASEHSNFVMWINNPAGTSLQKDAKWTGTCIDSNGVVTAISGSGSNSAATAFTGARFAFTSGNIASGSFRLYAIRNS